MQKIALITKISFLLGSYAPIISFLGAIIGGEETLILLSILTSHGLLNVWVLFIFFYLGIMVSDTLWYCLGKSKFFNYLVSRKHVERVYFYWGRLIDATTKKNDFQLLFIVKFLYGLRIPTIMYLARERLTLYSFLFYNLITNFFWVCIILLIGWSTGKGISWATHLSNNIVLYFVLIGMALLVFAVLTRILSKFTKKWLKKKQKQLN